MGGAAQSLTAAGLKNNTIPAAGTKQSAAGVFYDSFFGQLFFHRKNMLSVPVFIRNMIHILFHHENTKAADFTVHKRLGYIGIFLFQRIIMCSYISQKYDDLQICCVMQWILPPPSKIARAGTGTISRSGMQPRRISQARASSSAYSPPNCGTSTQSLPK